MFSAFQTFGRLGAGARAVAAAWTPLALWPTGTEPGMWISPSTLPASFNDYTGTTPVAVPGTVADSANPVGLALDIRAGAPETLGPEIIVGAPGLIEANWTNNGDGSYSSNGAGYLQWYGFSAAKTYFVSCRIVSRTNGSFGIASVVSGTVPGTYSGYMAATNTLGAYANSFVGTIDNISVKEVPGNHMLQSTSAARPLESARVNLLTYTEDFSSGWTKSGCTTPASTLTPPSGYLSAVKYIKNSGGGLSEIYRMRPISADSNFSVTAKKEEWRYLALYVSDAFAICYFDLEDGVIASKTSGLNASIVSEGDGWYRCSIPHEYVGNSIVSFFGTTADGQIYPTGDGVSGISVTGAQVSYGLDTAPYQPILTDGSTYTSTGITPWQLYDGVDDGMATAAFSAGTLTSAMDCMIPVRRDSGAACVAGLYNGIADATKFFGMAESASGSGCVGSGAGTPTVWVDGVQLTGGTAVTRGTLHTALTVGDYHILEFRGLDLSTWTASGFGLYSSYVFPGARGDIMLFDSTASTADKDAARQYLADKYGVTLP